jgi:hypothetical protein
MVTSIFLDIKLALSNSGKAGSTRIHGSGFDAFGNTLCEVKLLLIIQDQQFGLRKALQQRQALSKSLAHRRERWEELVSGTAIVD